MIDTTTMKDESVRFRVVRDGDLDLKFQGWIVGEGQCGTGGNSGYLNDCTRGTTVRVFLTKYGNIVTYVKRWSKWQGEDDRHDAAMHETPEKALAWLREDNGGSLGEASKEAWEMACRECPALKGCDVEEVM